MKDKERFDDELIRTYFRRQVEISEDAFDREIFLNKLDFENDSSSSGKGAPISGIAVSFGLFVIFTLTLIRFPSDERTYQESWVINADRNIRTIESMIKIERGK